MNDQNYETLGLSESSSFEEIQEARNRLVEQYSDDRKQVEAIESAYDAILMERLRLRQEGKIKVPDRIRFAEEAVEAAKPAADNGGLQRPDWLTNLLDTPSRNDVVWPAAIFAALAGIGAVVEPSLALAVGVGCTIYFLNRKERRFWRAILLTVAALTVGLALGIGLGQLFAQGILFPDASPEDVVQIVAAAVTLLVFWVVSSFLR